jgi:hypothetical protein
MNKECYKILYNSKKSLTLVLTNFFFMRLIQSFWSKNNPDFLTASFGWLAPEYHLMSWALSILKINEFYKGTTFYCDSAAAKILIDALQLPYNEVVCNMDTLNKKVHPDLWALPKIHTYSIQEQPFLHLDGDVYIWKKFDEALMKSPLIAQNLDILEGFENIMKGLETTAAYIPKCIIENRIVEPKVATYNAGIMGGSDVAFYKDFTEEAFRFIKKNTSCFNAIDINGFNVMFEQYLFYVMTKERNLPVGVLFDFLVSDQGYVGFGDFDRIPYQKQFIHLMGDYKRTPQNCQQMASQLLFEYPEYYYKILELYKKKTIPLYKTFHYFNFTTSEEAIAHHHTIKAAYSNNTLTKTKTKGNADSEFPMLNFTELTEKFDVSNPVIQKDAKQFCEKVNRFITQKMPAIAPDFLLGRDLNLPAYNSHLFADNSSIYSKTIVADELCEVIESHFDWQHFLDGNKKKKTKGTSITLLIPECNDKGFSFATIDKLELRILKILKSPKTVKMLLNELKISTDPSMPNEYEQLIFRKIKKAIGNKSMKVAI